jgi:hypothetical protein
MSSNDPDDNRKQDQTIVFVKENKETTATDDDLLSHANNLKKARDNDVPTTTGPETAKSQIDPGMLHISSGVHIDSVNEYTVDDIVDSKREGIDETNQIQELENRRSSQNRLNESLFPRITDEFLDNVEYDDDDDHHADDDKDGKFEADDCRNPELQKNSSNLSSLTRRYARMSTYHLKQNTTSKLPTLHDSVKTEFTDLYYQNASKIFPTTNELREGGHAEDIELGQDGMTENGGNYDSSQREKLRDRWMVNRRIKADLELFKEFVEPHKKELHGSFKMIATYVMLPSLIMAFILFYGFDNPPNGRCGGIAAANTKKEIDAIDPFARRGLQINQLPSANFADPQSILREPMTLSPTFSPTRKPAFAFSDFKKNTTSDSKENANRCDGKSLKEASISWWFLFIGVRQPITFCLAVLMQILFIDFFMSRTRYFPKLIGTELALALGQSKGWPCIVFFWALIDIILMFGRRPFASHWLYYQSFLDLMNSTNPSGDIPNSITYKRVIYLAIGLSTATTLKRTMMANFVGQRVVGKYIYVLVSVSFQKIICRLCPFQSPLSTPMSS